MLDLDLVPIDFSDCSTFLFSSFSILFLRSVCITTWSSWNLGLSVACCWIAACWDSLLCCILLRSSICLVIEFYILSTRFGLRLWSHDLFKFRRTYVLVPFNTSSFQHFYVLDDYCTSSSSSKGTFLIVLDDLSNVLFDLILLIWNIFFLWTLSFFSLFLLTTHNHHLFIQLW